MSITANTTALAADFVATPSGASDSGKVAKLDATGKIPTGFLREGGDGSDGALSVSSGTTTIDLAGAQYFEKNYTSISVTGTGKIAFINPHANGTKTVFKSQGNVTLTSSQAPMIDQSGLGAIGGTGANIGASTTGSGAPGNNGYCDSFIQTNGAITNGGGVIGSLNIASAVVRQSISKYPFAVPGAGGAGGGCATGGGGSTATGGNGGRGGGAFVIECAGAWNFTTAGGISVAGITGTNGATTGVATGAGGGGGGGAGSFEAFYGSLTANSGTVTITGGAAGTSTGAGGVQIGVGGGGGASVQTAGGNGTSGVGGSAPGGIGATGFSLIAKNTEYA